jgi:hypothetical protein
VRQFKLEQFPNGRWGIIMTAIGRGGSMVDTGYVDTLDEALEWIRERGLRRGVGPADDAVGVPDDRECACGDALG